MSTLNQYSLTRYHFPGEGEWFTLDQLKEKLAEWETVVDHSDDPDFPDRYTNYGWNLAEQPEPWGGRIPAIGKRFEIFVSHFFEPWNSVMVVRRESQNLFQVVRWEA